MDNLRPIIQCQDICIGYDKKVLFNSIHWTFEAGKLYTIKGLNGTGKSTLLKSIAGLQPLLKGKILLNGEDIFLMNSEVRARQIAYMGTQVTMPFSMTVDEYILMGRYPHMNWWAHETATDIAAVKQSIIDLKLEPLQHKKIHELSDGEFQQVRMAAALVREAPFILLDEPTSFLDYLNKEKLWTLLQSLAKAGKGIIIASHDMDYVQLFSDEIYEIKSATNTV